MNTRILVLALLLLAAPLAASPAEAAYLSCKVSEGLPTDTAGCFGCVTTDAGGLACATITVACVANGLVVTAEGQATHAVTWDVWFGTENVLYHAASATGDRYVNAWTASAYGGADARAWVQIDGTNVALAAIPCVPW